MPPLFSHLGDLGTKCCLPWAPCSQRRGGNPQDEMILGVPEVQQAAWGWWLGRVAVSLAPSGTWR